MLHQSLDEITRKTNVRPVEPLISRLRGPQLTKKVFNISRLIAFSRLAVSWVPVRLN